MPVFHTKTIESILDPVAQQVSRLVILHEEAEDGNAMPDLSRPVSVVSMAVTNLVRVGRETITNSDDKLLKEDMPASLHRVESSAQLLEDASAMLRADPYSGGARKKLIEGSRGILQGTSSLLLCFDESEVRKIILQCKRVLDYLAVAEVVNTMEELVQFLKDLSPCLSKVAQEVSARAKELTHQVHSEILMRCLEQVKTLGPILICSMKVYIHIVEQRGKGAEEAAENRNYLTARMSDEIQEIIRVLQLTTYEGDSSELDDITVLRKLSNAIANKIGLAHEWLNNPYALRGGVGEKALRQILDSGNDVAERCLPQDAVPVRALTADIEAKTNTLCDLRQRGRGKSAQAESLSRNIHDHLAELQTLVQNAVGRMEKAGLQQAAHTVQGRLEQAVKWLRNPELNDGGLGERAVDLIIEEGLKIAESCPAHTKNEFLQLCDTCQRLRMQASRDPAAAKQLIQKLHELKAAIQKELVNRIVQDFMDVSTPLKQFTEAVMQPELTSDPEQNFNRKSNNLQAFSNRAAQTSRMVAAGGAYGNNKIAETLLSSAGQIDSLTPQLISAGRIRMSYPGNKATDEHLNNLRQQYAGTVLRMRTLCDQATNPIDFLNASEEAMQVYAKLCTDAVADQKPQKMVDNTSNIARLINRVLLVAKQEADNSDDSAFTAKLNDAAARLEGSLHAMVNSAKDVAANISDPAAAQLWRNAFRRLFGDVQAMRAVFEAPVAPPLPATPPPPPIAQLSNLQLSPHKLEPPVAPPRPPLPSELLLPQRPPLPETDDEDDGVFRMKPHANQPILIAARGLHQEVRQWLSKDNEIIAAAKRMALLMARVSELMLSDSRGSKRELIETAKMIADVSEDVTRLAKEIARQCTDRRIRTNLLQVCERIPTIGTQLKILSTVKATMLGAQGCEEDREATEMLIGNAQNLMQSVKETVRAAEAASIKIRTDKSNNRLQWVRRQPWYQY